MAVIGGGPAGLTAAYELQRISDDYLPIVFEKGDRYGGIARTEDYKGFRFDIGGHRFFTKVTEVERLWHELMGDDFIKVPRVSRIFYRGRFFSYPLKPLDALAKIGAFEALRILLSYAVWRTMPRRPEASFEDWVMNRFGRRLYEHFFKSYTEKVWGLRPDQIQADWAAQRIRDLSLAKAVLNAFNPSTKTASLIEEFHYPRLGPGMMWEEAARRVAERGGQVATRSEVTRILRDGNRVTAIDVRHWSTDPAKCREERVEADHFVNSMALDDLIERFDPAPPAEVVAAARRLKYRDFLIVTLVLDHADPFPDTWIYVHNPDVDVARIQNFRSWSPEMVPEAGKASIGMEYFCTVDDALWHEDDAVLIEKASRELEKLGLAKRKDAVDGTVIRQRKAYPVYDPYYKEAVGTIASWINQLDNFQTVGRNGLHRYNNQDHSMLTAMLAARNIAGEEHDIWTVNVERAYHEEFQIPSDRKASVKAASAMG